MSLTFGLKSAGDMLAKLHREHLRLKSDVSPDNLFNFVVTAWHIKDWIRADPSAPASAKANLPYSNIYIAACRDLANASKHVVLNYTNFVTNKTTSAGGGYGSGPYGETRYGSGELSIIVVLNDGRRLNVLDLAQHAIEVWEAFFKDHGI